MIKPQIWSESRAWERTTQDLLGEAEIRIVLARKTLAANYPGRCTEALPVVSHLPRQTIKLPFAPSLSLCHLCFHCFHVLFTLWFLSSQECQLARLSKRFCSLLEVGHLKCFNNTFN